MSAIAATRAAVLTPASSLLPPVLSGRRLYVAGDQSAAYQDAARTTLASSDGDPVGSLTDLSGLGNHLSQSTASKRLTLKLGANGLHGLPVWRVDGVDDALENSGFALAQPYTVLVVFVNNDTDNGTLVDSVANVQAALYFGDAGGSNAPLKLASGGTAIDAGAVVHGVGHVVAAVANGASSSLWVDGVQVATGNPGGNGLSGLRLGYLRATVSANYAFLGDIAELDGYSRALSSTELGQWQRYAGRKYGFAVS